MEKYQHEVINVNSDLAFKLKLFSGGIIESPPHWHNSLEVMHVFRGAMQTVFRGKRYAMRDDDIIVINPKDVHSTHTLAPLDAALIQIPHEMFRTISPDITLMRFDFNTAAMSPRRKRDLSGFAAALTELYDAYRMKNPGYGLKVVSLLCDFFHRLYQNHADRHIPAKHKTEKYLHRLESVTSFVLDHYREPITIGRMSTIAFLNPEYFSRFFKKYMGMTPMEYLNLIRIQHIAAGLLNTDAKVADLAVAHGCNDYRLFLRKFRAVFGCTPRQYRQKPPPREQWPTDAREGVHVLQ